jgi:flavin-dependent dehydrogenase
LVNNRPPHNPRSGVIYPIEGNRWIVTLGGISRCYPPTDPEGFLAFARDLLDPRLYAAIKDAEPVSPVYGYQRTENRLRRYEQLDRMPEGLVAIGDAVCAFNPVYGQGMTVGALGALTLDAALRQNRHAPGFALRFQKQLAGASQTAWLLATGADFRWAATEGAASSRRSDRLAQRYIDRVMRASVRDPVASMAVLEVTHLLKPATAFFRPSVTLAAAKQAMRATVVTARRPGAEQA